MTPDRRYLLLVRWKNGGFVEFTATVTQVGADAILVRDDRGDPFELSRDQILYWSSPEQGPAFDDPTPRCVISGHYTWTHVGPTGFTATTTGQLVYIGTAAIIVVPAGALTPLAIGRYSIYAAQAVR